MCNRILSINELKLPAGLNAFGGVRAPVLEASRTFNVQVKIFFSQRYLVLDHATEYENWPGCRVHIQEHFHQPKLVIKDCDCLGFCDCS